MLRWKEKFIYICLKYRIINEKVVLYTLYNNCNCRCTVLAWKLGGTKFRTEPATSNT